MGQDISATAIAQPVTLLQKGKNISAEQPAAMSANKTNISNSKTEHRNWVEKVTDFFTHIFSGRVFKRRKGRAAELVKTATAAIPHPAKTSEPVVFKSTSSTLVSPISAYAGELPAERLRKLAEQQFKTMQHSRGATIN